MTKRLIVNADDLGRTSGVTEGILRAHREGIVTSATAMMNYSGAAALARAKDECPRLGLGVHLVFTSGRPLLPAEWVTSLVDERGNFLSEDAVFASPERLDLAELKSELKAQIKTFQNVTGHGPDHLDAHHFVHLLPRFFEVYLDLAAEFKLPARIPLPREGEPLPAGLVRLSAGQAVSVLAADRALLQAKPVCGPDRFIQSFFGDEALKLEYLLSLLQGLPEGISEMMTHPGLADETLRAQSTYSVQRERELSLLSDPAVRRTITDLSIELVTFSSIQ
jgi:predicted glycoside hydrolase/deacetylase ChbG (UPF0249 family)